MYDHLEFCKDLWTLLKSIANILKLGLQGLVSEILKLDLLEGMDVGRFVEPHKNTCSFFVPLLIVVSLSLFVGVGL